MPPPSPSPSAVPSYAPTPLTPPPTPTPTVTAAPSYVPTISPDLPLKFEVVGEYPAPQSMGYYPWDFLVEPFRPSVLRPLHGVSDGAYRWTVLIPPIDGCTNPLNDTNCDPVTVMRGKPAMHVTLRPKHAGRFYDVELHEQSPSHGRRVARGAIACKYVRRELRKLTATDRGLYFDGLKQIYQLSQDQGEVGLKYECFGTVLGRRSIDFRNQTRAISAPHRRCTAAPSAPPRRSRASTLVR